MLLKENNIMSKSVFAIQTHSFVDVITNSSTELFVCDTDKSIETVKQMLQQLINQTLIENGQITIPCPIYGEIFDEPFIYTKEMYDDRSDYAWGYEKESNIGKIMIMGSDDNSIPYELFNVIESTFDATSWHLG